MTRTQALAGTTKRNALAYAISLDRKLSGRGQRAKHYRSTGRPTLTRDTAYALFAWNRRMTANQIRADRAR